ALHKMNHRQNLQDDSPRVKEVAQVIGSVVAELQSLRLRQPHLLSLMNCTSLPTRVSIAGRFRAARVLLSLGISRVCREAPCSIELPLSSAYWPGCFCPAQALLPLTRRRCVWRLPDWCTGTPAGFSRRRCSARIFRLSASRSPTALCLINMPRSSNWTRLSITPTWTSSCALRTRKRYLATPRRSTTENLWSCARNIPPR